ncbi:alpha/beta hydrolase-fold protein [Nonlabens sp.]|uniref:alpha/beta hydrolase n=1 Tax=Nonlabens sp. TaxID=1888209 RepID=UPI0025DCC97C|nr:alpha/beta hydrolase-fold protein [Nonlabens sp.]
MKHQKNIKMLLLFTLLALNMKSAAQESLPKVISGTIERMQNFQSAYVTSRHIDIWLPDGYSDATKYPVVYMNDGQMLYDPEQSWNKQSWDIDDVASHLFQNKRIKKFIVVGIWHGGETRHSDYFPQKPFENLSTVEKDTINSQLKSAGRIKENFKPQSDNYLKFIVHELKPIIDKKYSVDTERENTYIMGSSMGGLISAYAICEYPEIFGAAACLSTHWVGTFTLENNPIPDEFLNYLTHHLPDPKTHKMYFDCGDQTLDALYPEIQKKADRIMLLKGYNQNTWVTKYFPGENHSEAAWKKRLTIPLEFLFNK